MLCRNMPAVVTLTYKDGSKMSFESKDSVTGSSYCYKHSSSPFPHFTVVDTNYGNAEFKRFHITDQFGTTEVRAFYKGNGDGVDFENFASTTTKVSKALADVWHLQAGWFWAAVHA
jgi:hypothetical protein